MGLRDRVALIISITFFSLIHYTLGVPCIFKSDKDDLFYDIFSPTEKKSDELFLSMENEEESSSVEFLSPIKEITSDLPPLEAIKEEVKEPIIKEVTTDLPPLEAIQEEVKEPIMKEITSVLPPLKAIKEEVKEPIAQQSKSKNSFKDFNSESLLKAFNFPEMEYSPSFYPEMLNSGNEKSLMQTTKNNKKKMTESFSPSLLSVFDFPEVEYPTKSSDVHKPYWNAQTPPFDQIEYNNLRSIKRKKDKKNKNIKTKTVKSDKVIMKNSKFKLESTKKSDENKNVTQIFLSNLSEESLHETFMNVSQVTYFNITDCPSGNWSTTCDSTDDKNLLKDTFQNDLIFTDYLDQTEDIVPAKMFSSYNSLSNDKKKDLNFTDVNFTYNYNNSIDNVNTDAVYSDFDEEFTTDVPCSDDSFSVSTDAPPFWEEFESEESFQTSKLLDELHDYFILV